MLRILIITFFLWQSFTRVFQTTMSFANFGKNDGWIFLDKMSFAPGDVEYRIRTQVRGIPYGAGGMVTLQAIPEYFWQQQKKRKCQDLPKEPFFKHKITLSSSSIDYTRENFNIEQTTLYYFVLKDCQKVLLSDFDNGNLSLIVRLHLQSNGRQMGQQEDHWYIFPIIIFAGVWLVYFYTGKLKGGNMKTQWHKMVMFGGIATQISSLTWRSFGYMIYVYTGTDYTFFHIIYLFMHSVSQSLVIGLVILIGFGWTINFTVLKDSDLYIPIIACLAFFNAVLTLITKLEHNQHDKHHLFDNIGGHIIIGYRVIFLVIFILAIVNTYKKSMAKVKKFILYFACFGGLYVSALPIIIMIGNNFVAAKDRPQFVFVAIEALKCSTNIALSYMLNVQKSAYNSVAYQKRSFMPQDTKYF